MNDDLPSGVTELLGAWSDGDGQALDRLVPLVYDELRRLARSHLQGERKHHTLQCTALANEVYLRLVNQNRVQWQSRAHFFAIAAQLMRRILVDHARRQKAQRRGGPTTTLALDVLGEPAQPQQVDMVKLDDALKSLARLDRRQCQIVELRFFGGLTVVEIARLLDIAPITVKREWRSARTWLFRELSPSGGARGG